jgi:tyrosyl-tRNA synthetase
MDVDLEVGGNDQTFNMLCGRDLMMAVKNKEKFVLTTKLLVDSAGKKMGKTEGNAVNLDDNPDQMFGKIMSWPDELIGLGLELCTDISMEEIVQIDQKMAQDKLNPRDAKARLAREIVAVHHDKDRASSAEKEFNRVFQKKEDPSQMPVYKLKAGEYDILDLLLKIELVLSKSEAKRLIEQAAVRIDNQLVKDWQKKINIKNGMIINVGKRKFVKIEV